MKDQKYTQLRAWQHGVTCECCSSGHASCPLLGSKSKNCNGLRINSLQEVNNILDIIMPFGFKPVATIKID